MVGTSKLITIIIVAVLLVAGGTVVYFASQEAEASDDVILRIGTTAPINGISLGDGRYSEFKMLLAQEALVDKDANGVYFGALAESWSCNSNFTVWTFNLRQGVVWSDGEPFDADDVVFNYRMKSARGDTTYTGFVNVTKVDQYTVNVTLSTPNSNFLVIARNMVQSPAHIYLEKVGPLETTAIINFTNYNEIDGSIGTGPYKLTDYNQLAGTLTFEVNDNYRGQSPSLKKIVISMYSNNAALMMALLSGTIDTIYSYVSPGMDNFYLGQVLSSSTVDVMTINYTGLPTTLFFNYDSPLGSNLSIRQAVGYAIDYEEIIRLVALVSGSMANKGVISPGNLFWKDTPINEYNVTKAMQILDDAGIVDTNNNSIREFNGTDIQLRIIVRQEQTDSIRALQLVKEYLEEVGLGVQIAVLSSSQFTLHFQRAENTTFDILTFIMTPAGLDMHAGYGTTYTQRNKFCNITDTVYTDIVDALLSTDNMTIRETLASDIQDYYVDEQPMIALYWSYYLQPYSKSFTGFVGHPYWGILCSETFMNLQYA